MVQGILSLTAGRSRFGVTGNAIHIKIIFGKVYKK